MNDLAERALHGLDVVRRQVAGHPMSCFGVLGVGLSAAVVAAGARVNAARPNRPLNTWLGLQDTHGVRPDDWRPGAAMLAAIVGLVLLWLGVVAYVRRHAPSERRLWGLAAAWAVPFALGPPLLGTSVQSYVAFGLLQRHGLSPYSHAPSRLGGADIVAALDPAARVTRSGAGPLGSLIQHVAVSVSAGNALAALFVLRGVAILAAILIGRFAAELAAPAASRALSLTVLNPLLLLFIVSGAHLDGVMIALVLAALAAAAQRRWVGAVLLAALAGSVAAPGFVAVPAIVIAHRLARCTSRPWTLVARDLAVAAVAVVACGLIVRDGFGWLRTIGDQFSAHTPYSVAGAIAELLDPVVRGASYDDLADGARITTITAMVCVLGYLFITARHRALGRTVGYALLAVALLAPVLYPWYLLWGTLTLAPNATGSRRAAVLALSVAGCVLMPQGFATPVTTNVVTGVALALLAVAVLARRRATT